MKKLLYVATAALMTACGNPNSYTIKGNVEGLEGTMYMMDASHNIIDSAKVEKGAFKFKGVAEKVSVVTVSDTNGNTRGSVGAIVYLEPGQIAITKGGNAPMLSATGTKINDSQEAYNVARKNLFDEYRKAETTDERREEILNSFGELTQQYLDQNLDNIFGVNLFTLRMQELSNKEAKEQVAKFSEEMQATEAIQEIKKMIEAREKTEIGQPYINFEQPDADGKMISLQSVIEKKGNKYVLLDFWASWCGPCMGEVPYLVDTYKAYHKKGFEIFGVSLDKDKAKWESAIKDKKMKWIHVSDLNQWSNAAAQTYMVQSIPSNFLIDCQTGKIIASQLRGEQLGEKIKELLSK